jgi:hypothetical protein
MNLRLDPRTDPEIIDGHTSVTSQKGWPAWRQRQAPALRPLSISPRSPSARLCADSAEVSPGWRPVVAPITIEPGLAGSRVCASRRQHLGGAGPRAARAQSGHDFAPRVGLSAAESGHLKSRGTRPAPSTSGSGSGSSPSRYRLAPEAVTTGRLLLPRRKRKRGSSMPVPTRWSHRIGGECRAARVRRTESGGKRPSLLTAAANVGTAKQTSARRKTRVAAGGADNGLHRADDDGRLAAA